MLPIERARAKEVFAWNVVQYVWGARAREKKCDFTTSHKFGSKRGKKAAGRRHEVTVETKRIANHR